MKEDIKDLIKGFEDVKKSWERTIKNATAEIKDCNKALKTLKERFK